MLSIRPAYLTNYYQWGSPPCDSIRTDSLPTFYKSNPKGWHLRMVYQSIRVHVNSETPLIRPSRVIVIPLCTEIEEALGSSINVQTALVSRVRVVWSGWVATQGNTRILSTHQLKKNIIRRTTAPANQIRGHRTPQTTVLQVNQPQHLPGMSQALFLGATGITIVIITHDGPRNHVQHYGSMVTFGSYYHSIFPCNN